MFFISFGDIRKVPKRRIAFFIILGWILGDILDTAGHPWDTMWRQGGRRGRHLEVILLSVFEAVFRDPKKATIATKWSMKVKVFHENDGFPKENSLF